MSDFKIGSWSDWDELFSQVNSEDTAERDKAVHSLRDIRVKVTSMESDVDAYRRILRNEFCR